MEETKKALAEALLTKMFGSSGAGVWWPEDVEDIYPLLREFESATIERCATEIDQAIGSSSMAETIERVRALKEQP